MLHTNCFSDLILQTKWNHKLKLAEVVNNDKSTELCAPHTTTGKKFLVSIHGSGPLYTFPYVMSSLTTKHQITTSHVCLFDSLFNICLFQDKELRICMYIFVTPQRISGNTDTTKLNLFTLRVGKLNHSLTQNLIVTFFKSRKNIHSIKSHPNKC